MLNKYIIFLMKLARKVLSMWYLVETRGFCFHYKREQWSDMKLVGTSKLSYVTFLGLKKDHIHLLSMDSFMRETQWSMKVRGSSLSACLPSLRVLPVLMWVSTGCSGFLP